jgi:predicted N-formylglutamate amidohydrolase
LGAEFYPEGSPSDERVVDVINPHAQGEYIVICEHASNAVPAEFGNLGLRRDALSRPDAWDRGALDVATDMSIILDAPLIAQRVSRLVYDCSRNHTDPNAIPRFCDNQEIPGNAGLTNEDRRMRVQRYYEPFCRALSDVLKPRMTAKQKPALITVHSFARVHRGIRRPVDIGILHDEDSRLADVLLAIEAEEARLTIRRNEPFGPKDGATHTLRAHAMPRGLLNVMFEIGNDLIADRVAQQKMATRLSRILREAMTSLVHDVETGDVPMHA